MKHPIPHSTLPLPLFTTVAAGFPSPADDHLERALDLNEHLIKHPAATYYVRANGDSMTDIGIHSGDLLIVDRSLNAAHGNIIIAAIDGELTCKILDMHNKRLLSCNPDFAPIYLPDDAELLTEGVVIASIRYHTAC